MSECERCAELQEELRKSHGIINQQIFRPKHPLDALSYNELQERVRELEEALKFAKAVVDELYAKYPGDYSKLKPAIDAALKPQGPGTEK